MDFFNRKNGELFAENKSVRSIATEYGTPVYIYSKATLERHWHAFDSAFGDYPHMVCYAVKANSNIAVLQTLAKLGSGFDVVSLGEIQRAILAGASPDKIVFSGLGKQVHEIEKAIDYGIACFNVESQPELDRIEAIARAKGVTAPISVRVNPDVNPKTHPYISTGLRENKFGVDQLTAMAMYEQAHASDALNPVGIDCHIGSQLTSLEPFLDSLEILLHMVTNLAKAGIQIDHIDLGGGLGVPYDKEKPPHPSEYASAIKSRMARYQGSPLKILIEPGRAIAANAGILVTQVEFLKTTPDKNFLVVDAAMNDMLRPSLYQAWQEIVPVKSIQGHATQTWDVVGPVCESGDFLGKDRVLHAAPGDLLAVRSAGAYGFCMSSNYNTRNRIAEVLVDDDKAYLIRRRETFSDQIAHESLLSD